MINFDNEQAVTIAEAVALVPGRPNVATIWRWAHQGVRGVRLEAVPVGGRWFTSREAIQRFLTAQAQRAGQKVSATESAAQKARIAKAERKLAAAGI